MSGLFTTGFQSLEAALTARERLQSTHAANIANADTPHYRADTRTFTDFFQAERSRQADAAMGTNQNSSFTANAYSILEGHDKAQEGQRLDGNTVDPQKEMADMAENQLMHELTMRMIKGKLSGLANAIKEGR
jgi:flagellar basal-body rod protein FlgB